MKWTPFTLHVSVTPKHDGKRTSLMMSLNKYAQYLYDALGTSADLNIANPGGGQIKRSAEFSGATYYNQTTLVTSSYSNTPGIAGTAVKPQFANYPAQLMITGFYNSSSTNSQTEPEIKIIATNETFTGARAANHINTPTATIDSEVKSLKATIDNLLTQYMPDYANAKIYRMEYCGIIYGNRGFTFPA